ATVRERLPVDRLLAGVTEERPRTKPLPDGRGWKGERYLCKTPPPPATGPPPGSGQGLAGPTAFLPAAPPPRRRPRCPVPCCLGLLVLRPFRGGGRRRAEGDSVEPEATELALGRAGDHKAWPAPSREFGQPLETELAWVHIVVAKRVEPDQ